MPGAAIIHSPTDTPHASADDATGVQNSTTIPARQTCTSTAPRRTRRSTAGGPSS
jgi:hypothetical protein